MKWNGFCHIKIACAHVMSVCFKSLCIYTELACGHIIETDKGACCYVRPHNIKYLFYLLLVHYGIENWPNDQAFSNKFNCWYIKMSSSESCGPGSRINVFKNVTNTMSILHITTELVNTPDWKKQPYHIDIFRC